MEGRLSTAGETVLVRSELAWADDFIAEALGDAFVAGAPMPRGSAPATLEVIIEQSRLEFSTPGWQPLTRDARGRDGSLVIRDVCTSGFDQHVTEADGMTTFRFRWRPPRRTRAASLALRSRFHLLVRAVLLQYPAMWMAARHGRAPLHAPAWAGAEGPMLLAGPGGVGKTTLIANSAGRRVSVTGDNLSCADGTTAWGVVEPIRIEGGVGRRMPHGRREATLANRVPHLVPERVVVLRRAQPDAPAEASPCSPDTAARSLVTGTYMAGELRRFWPYCALLAAGTGAGPSQPPVAEVATRFSTSIPCFTVDLPRVAGVTLDDVRALIDRSDREVGRNADASHGVCGR